MHLFDGEDKADRTAPTPSQPAKQDGPPSALLLQVGNEQHAAAGGPVYGPPNHATARRWCGYRRGARPESGYRRGAEPLPVPVSCSERRFGVPHSGARCSYSTAIFAGEVHSQVPGADSLSPWISLGAVQFTPTAAILWQESATAAHSVIGSPLAA